MTDQGSERAVSLWLVPAGLRGGIKTGSEVHSLSHQAHYLALFPAVYWDFGSLYQFLAGCLWSAVAARSNLLTLRCPVCCLLRQQQKGQHPERSCWCALSGEQEAEGRQHRDECVGGDCRTLGRVSTGGEQFYLVRPLPLLLLRVLKFLIDFALFPAGTLRVWGTQGTGNRDPRSFLQVPPAGKLDGGDAATGPFGVYSGRWSSLWAWYAPMFLLLPLLSHLLIVPVCRVRS